MKLNQIRFLVIAIAFAFFAPACSKRDDAGAEGGAKKKLKLAFVTNNPSSFWTIARAGTEEARKNLSGVEVDFRIPAGGSAAEQQQILDDLLAAGVDGIAVSPVDPANQTEMLNRVASQTLLVCHDSDAPDSKRVSYVGTDNVAAGVEAGKLIKQAIPQGGKIMLFVGTLDAQNAKDRYAGIKKELEGSNVEIIDVRTDETDRVRARKNVEDTLVKYPDIACVVGLWSYNGPAILNAVRDSGKVGKVKIVCFDEEDETLAGVASGDIFGTVVQQPYEFGKQAIERMAAYLRGDKSAFPENGLQIIPTLSIKKENVAEFSARLKRLLGK